MNLSLAVTSDDIHTVDKNLTILGSYTGVLREECSIDKPIIKVQVPEATAQRATHCAISAGTELNRTFYYFITDRVFYRDGIVEIHMECDYLMTFGDELKNVVCTVDRTETQEVTNAFMMDNQYNILACENIVTKSFPIGFSDESMVLLTVG